jgi:hypothetical protein
MNASNLQLLWASTQAADGRDAVPAMAHFATPIAVDGKVFLGTQNSVVVFGLLSDQMTARNRGASWIPEREDRGVRELEVLPF